MTALRAITLRLLWCALLPALMVHAIPGLAEDLPEFQFAFGLPAIEPITYWEYEYMWDSWPPLAADCDHVYVGGRQINIFCRQGEFESFIPFSSKARGIPNANNTSVAGDLALGPNQTLYVLDGRNSALHIYGRDGQFIRAWGGVGREYGPRAIAVSADGSVYVLDYPDRILHFTAEGVLLREWLTPPQGEATGYTPYDIAPAADGGVWLLSEEWWYDDLGQLCLAAHLHRYSQDGSLQADWPAPGVSAASRLEVDPEGRLWVLGPRNSVNLLQRFTPEGTKVGEVSPGVPGWTTFCVSEDWWLLVVRAHRSVTGIYVRDTVCGIDTWSYDGQLMAWFGNPWQMVERGALLAPETFAVDRAGETYIKMDFGDAYYYPPDYIVHHRPDGRRWEVTQTGQWPVYVPHSDSVEFAPWKTNYVAPDRTCHYYCVGNVSATPLGDPVESFRWDIDVFDKTGEEWPETPVFVVRLTGPVPDGFLGDTEEGWGGGAVAPRPDGNLLLTVHVCLCTCPGPTARVWVATLTPAGEVLSSWYADSLNGPSCARAVTVDPGGNVYIGGNGVWKYSPTGRLIGRVGGDLADALVLWASNLHIDAQGKLRVLDYMANRVVVFGYAPPAFSDVPYYHWAKDEVEAAVDAGVVYGYSDGLYHPRVSVSRDQVAAFIARALAGGDAQVPPGPAQPTFGDVPPAHWAYRHIEYCAARGIVTGFAGLAYLPALTLDRGHMAVFLARALAGGDEGVPPGPPAPSFADVPTDSYSYKYVEYIKRRGVANGYPDGLYHPDYVCTRDQMAVYIARAFGLGEPG